MRLIKVGFANINTTVGAFDANIERAKKFALEMASQAVAVAAFCEQLVSGYTPEDQIQSSEFIEKQWGALVSFCRFTEKLPYPTIFVLGVTIRHRGHIYNCAAVVGAGQIYGLVPKEKLPSYGEFYERRTCSVGIPYLVQTHKTVPFGDIIFAFPFGRMAVEVCEDIWSGDGPMRRRAYSGAEIVVNISSSPYRNGVVQTRHEMISTRAADNQVLLIYSSQLGGNDSLVCDGDGMISQNGELLFRSPRWTEGAFTTVVDMDKTTRKRTQNTTWQMDCERYLATTKMVLEISCPLPERYKYNIPNHPYPFPSSRNFFLPSETIWPSPRAMFFSDAIWAMVWGLAGYFEKTGAFKRIVISLSGGKDSVLSLLLCYIYAKHIRFKDLGARARKQAIKEFIHCFSFPTKYNSLKTRSISKTLCKVLGVTFTETSIQVDYEQQASTVKAILGADKLRPITTQNIQARTRGELMWDLANELDGLWIQSGNMSETAVGYTTVGGDQMGGFSLIGNLPKTIVIALLEDINDSGLFPKGIVDELLTTPASAELAQGQEDEKDLMPFIFLDAGMYLFYENKMNRAELIKALTDMFPEYRTDVEAWVDKLLRLFKNSVFKWSYLPPGVHLGRLDFRLEGSTRMPIARSDEWQG